MFLVYKATLRKDGRRYIGVTNNFKRRMKEHRTSPYPFGRALRKYGEGSFDFDFEEFETEEAAYQREAELVTDKEVSSDSYFNCCVGGIVSKMCGDLNPMRDPNIASRHPNIWTTENNPMNSPESKAKMINSQSCRKVSVKGISYYGVREAARSLGISRQCLVHRLKSNNFPDYFYL